MTSFIAQGTGRQVCIYTEHLWTPVSSMFYFNLAFVLTTSNYLPPKFPKANSSPLFAMQRREREYPNFGTKILYDLLHHVCNDW